ncbi:hypothetical protein G5I_14693 [Acromyrmex echinatior]|uniref:Uncharacterized protein n=1 Tax=Acromyrmex echinatior TaxID=103372 RepID=F4X8F4_ACREC|nr:hypothetical protein G5I_14693 [Acromyrmex echinatior]
MGKPTDKSLGARLEIFATSLRVKPFLIQKHFRHYLPKRSDFEDTYNITSYNMVEICYYLFLLPVLFNYISKSLKVVTLIEERRIVKDMARLWFDNEFLAAI